MSSTELYKSHRPETLDAVYGQDNVVSMLESMLQSDDIPQTMLFTGPSGCGKTTLARILANELGCSTADNSLDFHEINAAEERGIETIRRIKEQSKFKPFEGSIVFLLDECHKLSNDAQNALLKLLEDGAPASSFFFLASTDPQKLLKTIRNRATIIQVESLEYDVLKQLCADVCEAEEIELSKDVEHSLLLHADGSARRLLVLLNQIIHAETEEIQLEILEGSSDLEKQSKSIAQMLFDSKSRWPDAAKLLKNVSENDVESIRIGILRYANAILLNAAKSKQKSSIAAGIICELQDPFFNSGKPGFCQAIYSLMSAD